MNITINDLDSNTTLDADAMNSLLGGWHNHSRTTSYSNYRITGWSAWTNSGIPFTKKRHRDRYRVKTIRIQQHHRDWQYKLQVGFGF